MNKIITISRQFGSGGRTIGKLVAQKLNIPCYDREIIERVALNSGLAEDYIEETGEYSSHKTWIGRALSSTITPGNLNNEDMIWIEQRKVILNLVKDGPCVIVGRCADFILKDRNDVLSVFIHSDNKSRIDRIVNVYGEKRENPEKLIKDRDKRRSSYYKYYTETEWGLAQNCHIALNSGKLGIDECVKLIVKAYNT